MVRLTDFALLIQVSVKVIIALQIHKFDCKVVCISQKSLTLSIYLLEGFTI